MSDRAIIESIQQAAGTQLADTVFSLTGTVDSVDQAARTCVITATTGKTSNVIPDVRLMAAVDDGILIIPELGSTVQIIISTYTEPYVSQYSGVSSIVLLGGDLGGLVITPNLITQINLLENKVNSMISIFNAHTHPITTAPGTSSVTLTPVSGTLTPTVATDIANPNITQG